MSIIGIYQTHVLSDAGNSSRRLGAMSDGIDLMQHAGVLIAQSWDVERRRSSAILLTRHLHGTIMPRVFSGFVPPLNKRPVANSSYKESKRKHQTVRRAVIRGVSNPGGAQCAGCWRSSLSYC